MANSSIIGKVKNKIIKEFIKDKEIIAALDAQCESSPEELVNHHIFDFHQNPNTITTVKTFITIQVHIPQSFNSYYGSSSNTYVYPTIEIWIISNHSHMVVNNVPKVTKNRNDYLSELIDRKLNGRSDFGLGKLTLDSNIEGSYQMDYPYRKMTFRCVDLNNSLCEEE